MPFRIVGTSPPRVDGLQKVTGAAPYAGDLRLQGMLYGKILRCTIPHGRILRIDTSRAMELPGIVAIITGADVAELPFPFVGHVVRDRMVLATDRVRFIGEPIAAVAALSELEAEDALDLIEVDYEELPVVPDMHAALTPGAPLVHSAEHHKGDFGDVSFTETDANVCFVHREQRGNVAEMFAAATLVVEESYTFPAVFQFAMEPFSATAQWDTNEGLELWSACQHPFLTRAELADIFGLPSNRVRVHSPYLGGGFGSKGYTTIEPLVALLARKARRPVQVTTSIEESFLTTRRHNAQVKLATAIDASGLILGRRAQIDLDTGAYADNGPRVAVRAAHRVLGGYETPAFFVECRTIYTNTVPAGSYRAIGGPQVIWATESHLDTIAKQIGCDPIEFRMKNLVAQNQTLIPNLRPMDADLPGDLARLIEQAQNQPEQAPHQPAAATPGMARGSGMALAVAGGGAGPVATALVRLQADGAVFLHAGSTEMGQGSQTVLAMICAEELGVPLDRVRLALADSESAPFDRSTGASRATTVVGTAIVTAASDLRRQILEIASEMMECEVFDLRVEDGYVIAPDGRRKTHAQVVSYFYGMRGGELIGRGYSGPRIPGSKVVADPAFYEVSMASAEVQVDLETGEVKVENYITLSDVGRAIHPKMAKGQETGAVMQGLGHTLFEECHFEEGLLLNGNAVDYRLPLCTDLPPQFHSMLVENADGSGPYGCKGMGEGALMPVAPAIGNAFFNATGIRIYDLPLSPERVWRALRQS